MTLGTIMLCQALTYYILGYCLIQDRPLAPPLRCVRWLGDRGVALAFGVDPGVSAEAGVQSCQAEVLADGCFLSQVDGCGSSWPFLAQGGLQWHRRRPTTGVRWRRRRAAPMSVEEHSDQEPDL